MLFCTIFDHSQQIAQISLYTPCSYLGVHSELNLFIQDIWPPTMQEGHWHNQQPDILKRSKYFSMVSRNYSLILHTLLQLWKAASATAFFVSLVAERSHSEIFIVGIQLESLHSKSFQLVSSNNKKSALLHCHSKHWRKPFVTNMWHK